jgi:hypothetical protein
MNSANQGGFNPSDLLCPITHSWTPLRQVVEKLDKQKFVRFTPESVPRLIPDYTEEQLFNIVKSLSLLVNSSECTINVSSFFINHIMHEERKLNYDYPGFNKGIANQCI